MVEIQIVLCLCLAVSNLATAEEQANLENIFEIIKNDSTLQSTYRMLKDALKTHLPLRLTLDQPDQNLTFFVPTDEAWQKVDPTVYQRLTDGNYSNTINFIVYPRHILQDRALQSTDFRDRTYLTMNQQRIIMRRRGRIFELYWPYGNKVARLIQGGEVSANNGYIHKIDNVLIRAEDLMADI